MNYLKAFVEYFTPEKKRDILLSSDAGRILEVTYTYLDPQDNVCTYTAEIMPEINGSWDYVPGRGVCFICVVTEPEERYYLRPKNSYIILKPGHSVPASRILDIKTKWGANKKVELLVKNIKPSKLDLSKSVTIEDNE